MKAMVPWMLFQGLGTSSEEACGINLECPTTRKQVRTSSEGLVEVSICLLVAELGGSSADHRKFATKS